MTDNDIEKQELSNEKTVNKLSSMITIHTDNINDNDSETKTETKTETKIDIETRPKKVILKSVRGVLNTADSELVLDINDTDSIESVNVKSKKIRQYIVKNLLQPDYVTEIKNALEWRYRWRKIGTGMSWSSYIVAASASILAFIQAARPDEDYWAIISGITSIVGMVLQKFSSNAKEASKEKTHEVNKLLKSLDLDGIPELIEDETKSSSIKQENK
jgi:hypothetical protein